ncbi:Wadjet anti-phage system protein JetD domain-containing protein [Geoalkalibacter subterraneus]|uniref:Wadjet protein JetD C-terminal domain-containing protein n=1 Tax=Geoalkalibacter subterraneus TaxID=483547 RepID=A0A0B5FQN8_9BACT|nr:Wadjet anti-phage system protein JetD domain-containing protein [Geoalkalibacter subterraneus]AJF06410.1 hypothetical protein GSUB_07425 [Geoalkalibacter subterraneus]
MSWTTPADVRAQVRRLWDRGLLPAQLVGGEELFPRRITLKGPGSKELAERFDEVRNWIARLDGEAKHYRLVWRNVNHRILGANAVPAEIWVDSLDDALSLTGRQKDAQRLAAIVEETRKSLPQLIPWLIKRPLRALELADDWTRLLAVAHWLREHPRPGIYLRQIDLAGVHTKLIERHRGVLSELLDLVLPADAIDPSHSGVAGFCRRYGFRDKPLRVRFRVLDSSLRLLPGQEEQDITLTQRSFSSLELPVSKVFITENEINFLAFTEVPEALVIFGAGYGFENLASAPWLNEKEIHYWGDIDTHGFAILNQLRRFFPHARSFLMDRRTFLGHRRLWGQEMKPETANLDKLNKEEAALYDQLRDNHWGERIRLEQERVGFDYLCGALDCL